MEIAPIAGIRVMPVARVRPANPELTATFEIEASARPDDDSYSPQGKAAGAEEPEEDSEEFETGPEEEMAREAEAQPIETRSRSQVSFFA